MSQDYSPGMAKINEKLFDMLDFSLLNDFLLHPFLLALSRSRTHTHAVFQRFYYYDICIVSAKISTNTYPQHQATSTKMKAYGVYENCVVRMCTSVHDRKKKIKRKMLDDTLVKNSSEKCFVIPANSD